MDVNDYRLRTLLAMAMDVVDMETQIKGFIRAEFVYTHDLYRFLQRYRVALQRMDDADIPATVRDISLDGVDKLIDMLEKLGGVPPTPLQQDDAAARLWPPVELLPFITLTREVQAHVAV